MASVWHHEAEVFLRVAALAEELISQPAVAHKWHHPSALDGYTIRGLSGHLARAVFTMERYLDGSPASVEGSETDAAGYFVRALATHDPVSSDFHVRVRQRGEQEGARGPEELLARVGEAREVLAARLEGENGARGIVVLGDAVTTLGEYLRTRLVELVVHLDDLSVSIGREGPRDVPPVAYEIVAGVLAQVAARRVGGLATVRSLARRERRPEAIHAF